jgi:hypothetical protein
MLAQGHKSQRLLLLAPLQAVDYVYGQGKRK